MQSNQEIRARLRRRRRKKRLMTLLAALFAAAACAVLVRLFVPRIAQEDAADMPQRETTECTAQKGSITRTIYASGSVQPLSQPGVYAQTDGVVDSIHVEMGDAVKKGDVLVVLKNDALETEIIELQIALHDAQEAVEKVKTYEPTKERQLYWDDGRPRMDVDTGEPLTATYSNELMIRAPVKGRVMGVYVEVGDDALAAQRAHGSVFMLSTDGKMKVQLKDVQIGLLTLNQTVRITGEGVDTQGRVVDLMRRGTQARVEIIGDEYPMDTQVTVTTLDGAMAGGGILEINRPLGVSAYGGTIGSVEVKAGDMVEREDRLARFALGDKPLYIENASILHDYAVALASLEAAQKKSGNLSVLAPCDGFVASVDMAEGDEATDGTLLVSLVEDVGMQIILTVDELDIPFVEAGQRVVMTADALEGVEMTGRVLKIAPLGNTETAVTTYDVYIQAYAVDERVLGGMNVSGEIEAESAQDAVLIATDALQKDEEGYFVTMRSGETRRVQTGIMTVEHTQILSGLESGETVVY